MPVIYTSAECKNVLQEEKKLKFRILHCTFFIGIAALRLQSASKRVTLQKGSMESSEDLVIYLYAAVTR